MRLCLNMIVRNEADKIVRCLRSVYPYISSWVICDTGSTDDTVAAIEGFFRARGIPGRIVTCEFDNFSQARNVALASARELALNNPDYFLLCDADMELVVENPAAFDNLTGRAYLMTQKAGGLAYHNVRLLKADDTAWYVGPTHEYIDATYSGLLEGAHFVDHADGSNRSDKYTRDVRLLVDDLLRDPKNGRSWFYLAQSYRELGRWPEALCCYQRRVEVGGWDEEVWNAQFNIAHCHKNMGNEAEFIRNLLLAYNMRPRRAEPLFDLAHHFRDLGWNAPAALFAEVGMAIPYPNDSLFVNEWVYKVGLREEFSIAGFYNDRTKQKAFETCNELSLVKGYDWQSHQARRNLYHYLPRLDHLVRSFRPERIELPVPDGYTAMNPSVAMRGSELCCVVRAVNYVITPDGQYAIKGNDGSVNNANPIHTRNLLARFGTEFGLTEKRRPHTVREIVYKDTMPVKYGLVRGFEDMRLIPRGHDLFISACVRELDESGVCRQVLAKIGKDHTLCQIDPIYRVPEQYEKNWMPILRRPDEAIQFMYRLNHLVDADGKDVKIFPSDLGVGHISGGSQVIPFFDGWLALVHEAMQHDDYAKRYYQHRFAFFNEDLSLRSLSLPFVFLDKQIEFAAGLCWLDEFHLCLSFGVRDCEAWMARIDAEDVMEMVHA